MHGTLASLGAQKALQEDFAKAEPVLRIFALLTTQETAASETMLCEDDVRSVLPLQLVLDDLPGDVVAEGNAFVDVTDNDQAACRWCGRDRDGLTG